MYMYTRISTGVSLHVCMYACMYVSYVCYVCLSASCIYIYTHIHNLY